MNCVVLQPGGGTTLKGTVVAANQVKADVGGNLHHRVCPSRMNSDKAQPHVSAWRGKACLSDFYLLNPGNFMKTKLIATVLLAQAMLVGCASNNYTDAPPTMGVMYSKYAYIGYAGDLRPIEDVGIVTTDGLIKIRSVNNQSTSSYRVLKSSGLYSGGRYQLHLAPGTHVLTMGFSDDRGGPSKSWSVDDITKTISIAKGQVIHLSLSRNGRAWTAKESDGSSALAVIASDFKDLGKNK